VVRSNAEPVEVSAKSVFGEFPVCRQSTYDLNQSVITRAFVGIDLPGQTYAFRREYNLQPA